uniref:Uncharacterized protein n=2 Tax=Gasterosteus aculeatus TaxID=69293 RepID=G3PCH7_GASAC
MDSTERSVTATQPVLLQISVQAMEAEEQMKPAETVTSSDTETKQAVGQTETTEGSPTHQGLSEAAEQQTETKTPAKQKEEEQDVWMDAEERCLHSRENRCVPSAGGGTSRRGRGGT